jgi:2',3'-cyclic-nucleotide 2'-phosphodiesterase (5'-nucleotidase family)
MFAKTMGAACLALACCALAPAQSKAETEAFSPAQAAADVLRDAAGADGAFLAAGMIKSTFQQDNLATLLEFPNDEIVVVALTGAQIKQAFERSVSLYPQPNSSFLQISGFEVTFSPSAPPNSRVKSATAGGAPIEDGKSYTIAMPVTLARGGYGYFKIWDRNKIVSTVPNTTVEKALTGKRAVETRPRWVAQS